MPPDSQGTGGMTVERLNAFFDAWNAHDVDRVVSFFTADGAYYASIGPDDDGTPFRGADEVRRGVSAFLTTYADAHYTDISMLVRGDRGFAGWTFSGTAASGLRVTYRGVDIFEFVADRIRLKDAFRKERSQPIGSQARETASPEDGERVEWPPSLDAR